MPDKNSQQNFVQDSKLSEAIGRVAMASAEADRTLTHLLDQISRVNDHSWILFRGQSSEWLNRSIIELIKFGGAPYRSTTEDMAAVQDLLGELKTLHGHRNTVIHGTWSTAPQWGEVDDEEPEWRPRPRFWGDRDEEVVFYCHRTRLRKVPPDQAITISDVRKLAEKIEAVSDKLWAIMDEIKDRPFPVADASSN